MSRSPVSWITDVWDYLRGKRPKPTPTPKPPINPPPIQTPRGDCASVLLTLHNQERNTRGLSSLQLNWLLNSSAQQEASACALEGRLDHNAGGTTPFSRINSFGYLFSIAGENIAEGYKDPQSVVKGWMSDAPHKHNVLGPYVHVGFGMAVDKSGRVYWAADYASPSDRVTAPLAIPCPGGISHTDIVE